MSYVFVVCNVECVVGYMFVLCTWCICSMWVVYVRVCACMCMRVCTYVCLCACVYLCVCTHMCMCTCKYSLSLLWYQPLSVLAQRGPEARSSRYQDSRIVIVTEILVFFQVFPGQWFLLQVVF